MTTRAADLIDLFAGRAKQDVSEEVTASLAADPDPIDETALPRDQREHSKEYFEKLLKGE